MFINNYKAMFLAFGYTARFINNDRYVLAFGPLYTTFKCEQRPEFIQAV